MVPMGDQTIVETSHELRLELIGGYRVQGLDALNVGVEFAHELCPKSREVLDCASPLALWITEKA